MSVLSDRDIRAALDSGAITIEPYDHHDLQPSSVDLHLDQVAAAAVDLLLTHLGYARTEAQTIAGPALVPRPSSVFTLDENAR